MKIIVNGEAREVSTCSLAAALDELGYEAAVVATALNGDFVAVGDRRDVVLSEGDELEVLAPMQGG
jgi:sulfur carrier protein